MFSQTPEESDGHVSCNELGNMYGKTHSPCLLPIIERNIKARNARGDCEGSGDDRTKTGSVW